MSAETTAKSATRGQGKPNCQVGNVDIPQEAFLAVLVGDREGDADWTPPR